MKISLLYTTARPHLIHDVIKRWRDAASNSSPFEWVISTDAPVAHAPVSNVEFIVNTGRKDCVTGWNLAAARARGDVFVQVSDDLFPPSGWNDKILRKMARLSLERPDVVLNLLDERKCTSAVYHPVLTRAAYEKLGYLYPPEFESMYCDNWFCEYHKKYSLYALSKEKFWTHIHRTTHHITSDSVTLKHVSRERYQRGKQVLEQYIKTHRLFPAP